MIGQLIKTSLIIQICVISFLGSFADTFAAEKWTISSSLQYSTGNYVFDQNTSTFYLYGGLRYQSDKWSLFTSIPLISQNSDLVTGSGGAFFPSTHHDSGEPGSSHHGGNMAGGNGMANMTTGLGDLYLSAAYQVLSNDKRQPYIAANLRIKAPTAGTENGFGSGEFDYGASLTVRKRFQSYIAVAEVGFWVLGDPAGITYKDPLVFGIGAGKFFNREQTGLLIYYQNYSTILNGLEPIRQVSLGLNHQLRAGIMLTAIGLAGLSETTPDFSFSSGLEWAL
ncbi:MAG: hypothetical protein KDH95_00780 [Calditrichaeota bacterium]|nr:hypothetical protein [Calditrichota bacterium]MCB0266679.1 hypothetical protein [Calditrichota bacterium]